MRVLAVLAESLHVRNIAGSGLLSMLRARGHEVHALVPARLAGVTRDLASGISILPVEPYRGSRWRCWLRAGPLRTASYVTRAARGEVTYATKLGRRVTVHRGDRSAPLWRALGAGHAETLAVRLERVVPIAAAARCLVEQIRPDVVFIPTTVHEGSETEIAKAAQAAGVPVVAMPATWDTLTSKGAIFWPYDRLMVWGEQSASHAARLHGVDPGVIDVVGPPQYDLSAEPPVGTWGDRSGPMVLVAGSTLSYWQDEATIVERLGALGAHAPSLFWVWYRPHPRRPLHEVRVRHANVHVDQRWRRQAEAGGGFDTDSEGLRWLGWLLRRATVVVTAFSTLVIEAALEGCPSLLVAFGASTQGARLLHHAGFGHMAEVVTWPGIVLCGSQEALDGAVTSAVAPWPESFGASPVDRAALRARAVTVARVDGHARERIIAILEHAAHQRQERLHAHVLG